MKILTNLEVRELVGTYRQLTSRFIIWDAILGTIIVPKGFICDYESVPLIRGSSKRAGVIHDYLYRIDSVPRVSRHAADRMYLRIMKFLKVSWPRRIVKYNAVRFFGGDSYHKLKTGGGINGGK